jgi:LacI family transcriptional regulator
VDDTADDREPSADSSGMRQVAERAGVAMSSVSRVLSDHPDVSDKMRARVLKTVKELGYEPNMLAQMLRRGTTQTVGFVIGDISNPLLGQIALGAEVALREAQYAMLLTNSLNQSKFDVEHIKLLQQRQVDGLLLSVADESNEETIAALGRTKTPSVLIDRDLDLATPASAVLCDHAAGVRTAVEYLIELGHRDIALIAGSPFTRPTRERVRAIKGASVRHPMANFQIRSGAFTETHGAEATRELLASSRPPTAVIAGGNQILIGVLRQLRDQQLRIPQDISLITCDDVPLAEFFTPALATIERDPYAMGTTAAGLLLELMNGGEARTIDLRTTFRRASSCARPAPAA